MKRIIVLLLVLVLSCLAFASCDMLPDEVKEILGITTTTDEPAQTPTDDPTKEPEAEAPHEHDFVLKSEEKATCSKKGKATYECECGETKTTDIPKSSEHAFIFIGDTAPTCTAQGKRTQLCTACGKTNIEYYGEATGHNVSEFEEYSRMMACTNAGCSYAIFPEGNGTYSEVIVYKANEVEEQAATFETVYNELDAMIKAADKYDPALHGFVENSELYAANKALEEKYSELVDIINFVTGQYQIAQLEYYLNVDAATQENFNYIASLRTDMVAKYYTFSAPIAESMFREYFYEGMTDEEIDDYVGSSDAVSNPEYTALVNRNDEIESEYLQLYDAGGSSAVPVMYEEFVANNKRIAEILGYDSYLTYAYSEIYGREYTYSDAKEVYEYVKEYIVPVFNLVSANAGGGNDSYGNKSSFFEVYDQNKSLNDYIDLLTITGNKTVSFSDEFNSLMGDGRCFRGGKGGTAYVTSLYGVDLDGSDLPIAYFSKNYENFFTIAHEFGHFMNEVYSEGKYNQSYDLLEMHSQGNEMLFLAYLNNNPDAISPVGLAYLNVDQPLNMLETIVNAIAVDAFEQAVYTDFYDGPNAEEIMDFDEAKGVYITADEYDLLYKSVYEDLGVENRYRMNTYWRYAVLRSPCYYISYSISALSVLQLLPMGIEDFDAAAASYLKLFSYVDEYENGGSYMSTVEVLEYAGLNTFMEEALYQDINEYFMAKYS